MALMQQETNLACRQHSPLCLQVQAFTLHSQIREFQTRYAGNKLSPIIFALKLGAAAGALPTGAQSWDACGAFGCDGFAPDEIYFRVTSNEKIMCFFPWSTLNLLLKLSV